MVVAAGRLVARIAQAPLTVAPFAAGALLYYLLWRTVLGRPGLGSFFTTLEHEFTHALFAWLTLHTVTGLSVTWRDGGSVTIRGPGNWLITASPYFFPTLTVILLLVALLLPPASATWFGGLLGLSFCYHLVTNWRQIHRNQLDLQRIGFLFSWLFLPGANLFGYALIIAVSSGGSTEVARFLRDVASLLRAGFQALPM